MRAFYGCVYDGLFSRHSEIMADATAKQAAFNVVLDAAGLAAQLARALPADCQVMVRHSRDEKAFDHHPDAAAHVRDIVGAVDGRLVYEVENEPSVPPVPRAGEPNREALLEARREWMRWHADWCLAGMDEADRLGARLVVGNWSTGVPEPEDFPIYRAVLARAAAGRHLVGLHVYYTGSPTHPMTISMVNRIDAILGVEPRLHGRIVLTETGAERDGSVPGSGPWKRLYARDQTRYWHDLLGFFELLRNRELLGAALFLWREREQGDWGDYDLSEASKLNGWIAGHTWGNWLEGEMASGQPIPTDNLKAALLASTADGGTLIRRGPGTEYGRAGGIPKEGVAGWADPRTVRDAANKYDWVAVRVGEVEGWAALAFLDIRYTDDGNAALRAEITRLTAEVAALTPDATLGRAVRALVAG